MLRQNPHLLLMGALDFSASDLAANSAGQFSPDQHQRIHEARLYQIGLLVVGAILLWISGIALHVDWLPLVFISAMLVTLILSIVYRTQDDLKSPVQAITGRVGVHPRLWSCQLIINGETFSVARGVGAAFVDGRIYRLYYTRASRILLSAELMA